MRASLVTKLVGAYLAPTLALLVFAPLVGYAVARQSLEEQVGERLAGIASAAAATLRPDILLSLQPGDEGNRTHRNVLARLESLRAAGNAERLYAFSPDRRLLAATGQAPPIGAPLPELQRDRAEIERALSGVPSASSVTFVGLDRRTYKSGYAPVLDAEGRAVALVGADASAEFFSTLRRFGASMVGLAAAFGLVGLLIFWLAGHRWLIRPIRDLSAATDRIGRGDLASEVSWPARDELGALASGMDLMRRKLFDRERELQTMLAGIAHEVRNPLGGIELFAGLLAEELAGDQEKLSHVRRIQRELGHLARVVEDFLGYARDPNLELEAISAPSLLAEVSDLARPDAQAREVTVEVDAPPFEFRADPGALRRALLNLARNAVQAAPRGGRVVLSARLEGDRALLSVVDDGPGVPPEERDRLFTPFHTTKEKGLGLGLALARRVAEAHRGTARLADSPRGARFVIELPAGPR